MTSGDQGPGQINGSIDFTATGDEIIGPTNAALDLIATDFTISAWALNPVSSWKTIVSNGQGRHERLEPPDEQHRPDRARARERQLRDIHHWNDDRPGRLGSHDSHLRRLDEHGELLPERCRRRHGHLHEHAHGL